MSEIKWFKRYDRVLDDSKAPLYRWFTGGLTNMSYNCIDRHVEAGNGEDVAVYYESAYTKRTRVITYNDLQDKVSRFSKVLSNQGVKKGDRVIIYMPMIPEALIAMHACARLGAIHSVVFGGFAPEELANRVSHAKPKVIVTASAGLEPNRIIPYTGNVDRALEIAGVPEMKRIMV
jgi:propionyl-CoA synthetase